MTDTLRRFLVPSDGSDAAREATTMAIGLAKRYSGEVIFCHVIDRIALATETASMDGGYDPASIMLQPEVAVKGILAEAEARAHAAGVSATTATIEGPVVKTIVAFARERKVDAIVIGRHARNDIEAFFLGSTTDGVLTNSALPVIVVHANENDAVTSLFSRILVGVDNSETGAAAFAFALRYAADAATIVLCNVIETSSLISGSEYSGFDPSITIADLRKEMEATMTKMAATATAAGLSTEIIIVEGATVDQLVATASQKHASLVVVGTHGRHGLERFILGSVAGGVARHSPVAVAVVHV